MSDGKICPRKKPDSVVLNGLLSEDDDYGTTCCHNCSRAAPDELIKSFLIASKLKYCLGRKNVPQNTIYFVSALLLRNVKVAAIINLLVGVGCKIYF